MAAISIHHAPGAHDDIANAVAGCVAGLNASSGYESPRLGVQARRSGTRYDTHAWQWLGASSVAPFSFTVAMMKEKASQWAKPRTG